MPIISGLFFSGREKGFGEHKHQSAIEALNIRPVFVLMIVPGD